MHAKDRGRRPRRRLAQLNSTARAADDLCVCRRPEHVAAARTLRFDVTSSPSRLAPTPRRLNRLLLAPRNLFALSLLTQPLFLLLTHPPLLLLLLLARLLQSLR